MCRTLCDTRQMGEDREEGAIWEPKGALPPSAHRLAGRHCPDTESQLKDPKEYWSNPRRGKVIWSKVGVQRWRQLRPSGQPLFPSAQNLLILQLGTWSSVHLPPCCPASVWFGMWPPPFSRLGALWGQKPACVLRHCLPTWHRKWDTNMLNRCSSPPSHHLNPALTSDLSDPNPGWSGLEAVGISHLVQGTVSSWKRNSCREKFLATSGGICGEGNGNPLQYSCLKNPMDRGASWVRVQEVQRVRNYWVTEQRGICWGEVRRGWNTWDTSRLSLQLRTLLPLKF